MPIQKFQIVIVLINDDDVLSIYRFTFDTYTPGFIQNMVQCLFCLWLKKLKRAKVLCCFLRFCLVHKINVWALHYVEELKWGLK